ncbi:VWA domain-containing protein [bacterium]|nr:VWA domain-containing protein [candidate division CSSED10-310 bacterium]
MKIRSWIISVLLIMGIAGSGFCADSNIEQYNIVVLLDASSHMNAKWGDKPRFQKVVESFGQALTELNRSPSWGLNLGLRIFGDQSPRSKNDCADYRSGAKLDWFEPTLLTRVLEGTHPKGRNCLSNALGSIQYDLTEAKRTKNNYILCIVSGRDECTKDEKVTMDWLKREKGITAIYIIGSNVSAADSEYFESLCKDTPGGYANATSPEMLSDLLTRYLTLYCQGKSVAADPEKTNDSTGETTAGDTKDVMK